MKCIVAEVYPAVLGSDVLTIKNRDHVPIVRVFPTGVVETYQGYDPGKVAQGIWALDGPRVMCALVFFPNERGEGLVTFKRDGKPTYREDYTPDPVARELWEAIAKADPRINDDTTPPEWNDSERSVPGFLGVWGTGGSIDCFRPR